MATTINQARTSIFKMFNGEPRSYTRFNLAQNSDADSSQVEMKLSSDVDDEVGNPEDGQARVTYTQSPLRTYKNICYLALGTLVVFILGYLVGYVSHRKPDVASAACPTVPTEEGQDEGLEVAPLPRMNWNDITNLLEQKLSPSAFSTKFSDFSLPRGVSHEAGSDGDNKLANKVLGVFKDLNMKSWNDEHFVKLPHPSSDNPNKVIFGTEVIGTTKGYLAYSEVGTATGRVVYANYGTLDDFLYLDKKVEVNSSVLLLRAGNISFAEKVANAAKYGAVAVLIYPDPSNYNFAGSTELYGHVHLGSGDPYTPGMPSFKNTQFPPARSSGLPTIVAQTITADIALKIFQKMGGDPAPNSFKGSLGTPYKLGSVDNVVTVTVSSTLNETAIHNIFGVIKGNEEPDRYVVIGAQRDSWGPGAAKSTVGTTVLVELARAISEMTRNDHLSLRRSLVFASWSAGEYGSVGATEWQEGYLSSLNMKAITYINLDGVVIGRQKFKASASPLLYDLLQKSLKQVKSPFNTGKTLYDDHAASNWETSILEAMKMDDAAYPFMALSGIPSISFRFCGEYPYLGTTLDTFDHLQASTSYKYAELAAAAANVAGQMALRLAHDHLVPLDVARSGTEIRKKVTDINRRVNQLKNALGLNSTLAKGLSVQWLNIAIGSYGRAARDLQYTIDNSDLENMEMRRIINDRIIKVEHNLLSPYVSVRDVPFRHILFGSGCHTIQTLLDHLDALKQNAPESDADLFRNQFAWATWTIQSCANDLAGPVWEINNEI
ncbi:hypothetical protein AALO_G00213400 [Alosa alosa]|uniref:Transferrin receptor protein 1 n=1 Tax=Alosa alosa TaxID=278164 RepID=A0AAV6G0C7_9TELE|nr:transferrin receptor 1b [Alosa alosa]KAG5268513.1 hypothetical protein AALO_G00213400 [Alosa alosa]